MFFLDVVSSAAVLVFCLPTSGPSMKSGVHNKEKPREVRGRNIFWNFQKTQYLMNTLYISVNFKLRFSLLVIFLIVTRHNSFSLLLQHLNCDRFPHTRTYVHIHTYAKVHTLDYYTSHGGLMYFLLFSLHMLVTTASAVTFKCFDLFKNLVNCMEA